MKKIKKIIKDKVKVVQTLLVSVRDFKKIKKEILKPSLPNEKLKSAFNAHAKKIKQ